jgi:hypothetical protein
MAFSPIVYTVLLFYTLNNILLRSNTRKWNPTYPYVIQDRIFSNWIKYVFIHGQTGSCVWEQKVLCHNMWKVLMQSSALVLSNSKKYMYWTRIGNEATSLLGMLHYDAWKLSDGVTSQQYRAENLKSHRKCISYMCTYSLNECLSVLRRWYEERNQLDATQWFIELMIRSTCFGQHYAHHQELDTLQMFKACGT